MKTLECLLLYLGLPSLLAVLPGWVERRWGVRLNAWVIPTLLVAAAIAYAVTLLIYRLLGQHTDKPVCAAILGSDVPLRLPAGKLSQKP